MTYSAVMKGLAARTERLKADVKKRVTDHLIPGVGTLRREMMQVKMQADTLRARMDST